MDEERLAGGERNVEEDEHELVFQERPPIGLTLTNSASFLNLLQTALSQPESGGPLMEGGIRENQNWGEESSSSEISRQKIDDFMSQPMSEKLKASNFPINMLTIGAFQRVARNESDLVGKLYYAKRKLVWEFLDGPLKKKIEIQWSDIGAMRATMEEGQPGIWEIELNQPPLFFHETNPQPRKHTLWQSVGDFTNGQAAHVRRHVVRFSRGVLDMHYKKLLQCDPRLRALSEQPFPNTQNPTIFFPSNPNYELSNYCLNFQHQTQPIAQPNNCHAPPISQPNNWHVAPIVQPNNWPNVAPILQPTDFSILCHMIHQNPTTLNDYVETPQDHHVPTYNYDEIVNATTNPFLNDQNLQVYYNLNLENVSHQDQEETPYHESSKSWAKRF